MRKPTILKLHQYKYVEKIPCIAVLHPELNVDTFDPGNQNHKQKNTL